VSKEKPDCPVCNDSGKVTVQDAPFGKPFPAEDQPHVQTPDVEIPGASSYGREGRPRENATTYQQPKIRWQLDLFKS
jgi:hypothetical protein